MPTIYFLLLICFACFCFFVFEVLFWVSLLCFPPFFFSSFCPSPTFAGCSRFPVFGGYPGHSTCTFNLPKLNLSHSCIFFLHNIEDLGDLIPSYQFKLLFLCVLILFQKRLLKLFQGTIAVLYSLCGQCLFMFTHMHTTFCA